MCINLFISHKYWALNQDWNLNKEDIDAKLHPNESACSDLLDFTSPSLSEARKLTNNILDKSCLLVMHSTFAISSWQHLVRIMFPKSLAFIFGAVLVALQCDIELRDSAYALYWREAE